MHLFGSVANGLSIRAANDLDVCLELHAAGAEAKSEVVEALGALLERAGMRCAAAAAAALPTQRARCPAGPPPRLCVRVAVATPPPPPTAAAAAAAGRCLRCRARACLWSSLCSPPPARAWT